jgi:uncharacterized protein YwqG
MMIDELIAVADKVGLAKEISLRGLAREAIALLVGEGAARPANDDSRLGGRPSLPPGVRWPKHQGQSLAFIGQLNLEKLPTVAEEEGLPQSGRLLFFYDADQRTWGGDPNDTGSFTVIHVAAQGAMPELMGWPDDLPEHARYTSVGLVSEKTVCLPPWESVAIDALNLGPRGSDAYLDLLKEVCGEEVGARGLFGGYPDQIQNDMTLECARVAAGLNTNDGTTFIDDGLAALRVQAAREQALRWRLLLQVPSADDAGMMWGDVGCLYYLILDEDLRSRRFDRVWMILQCA